MDLGYTTSYGAQGGSGGGGFMAGSQGEGNSASTKQRNYKADSLRPVTIKQLIEAQQTAPDSEVFLIDGNETTQVAFVGQVRNIAALTTNTTYKLDDGTGTIEAKVWIDQNVEQETMEMETAGGPNKKKKPVEQEYARVFGRLKEIGNKRWVGANIVRPIDDFNEVSCHLLEATAVHLYYTKGPPETLQQQQQGQAGGDANGYAPQQQNGFANGSGSFGGDPDMGRASQAAKKVFTTLRQTPQTNEGLHAQDIAGRTGLELSEVYKAGDELIALGKIYTTVDDQTWAPLDI